MKRIAIGLLIACLGMSAWAAFLESDEPKSLEEDQGIEPPVIRPPIGRPPVRPAPGLGELSTLLSRVRVGDPYVELGWAVFPLEVIQPQRQSRIYTLDEALRRGWLTIQEADHAVVSTVMVRNRAPGSVFIMAGEVLLGGRQNRIVQAGILLPTRSGFVSVPVYCGEKERWGGPVVQFKASPGLAQPYLRKEAAGRASQDKVWRTIDEELESSGVSSQTRDYQQIYAEGKNRTEVNATCRRILPVLPSRTVGLVLVRDSAIRSCDLFSDPNLFNQLRDKILPSYALEMHKQPVHRRHDPGHVSRDDVRQFLQQTLSARVQEVGTNGQGRLYQLSGAATGEALIWQGSVVHAGLFPRTHRF